MKLIGRILSIIIILGALAALCLPADAGAYLYPGKRKKVYCGIAEIVDPMNGKIQNDKAIQDAALLFFKLDNLNSMKPSGWTFENPLAMSQDKSNPYYWRIRVSSARNLSRLNVLYLPGSGSISLTDDERENLRRFVDGGGVIWVDNSDANSPLTFKSRGPFFIDKLNFKTGVSGSDGAPSRHHPLLCSPYWLTDVDIMSLGMNAGGSWGRCYCDMGPGGLPTAPPTSFDILFPIVDSTDGEAAVVANTYGSGRVVATANAVGKGCMLSEPYSLASLKFAFNIMAYASTWTDLRKDPRHSGSSIDTLGANRLVEKWSIHTSSSAQKREAAPLIYKNTIFYTSGNTLCSLDQNGDTHGGVWPAGPNGEVIIWHWTPPSGGLLSSPTIATIQDPNQDCGTKEAVLVMDDQGTVFVLDAFPINPDNTIRPVDPPLYTFPTAPASGTSDPMNTSKWPSPPVYVNGWIYALGGDGRLWAVNPCLQKWADGHAGAAASAASPTWRCPDESETWTATPKCGPSFGCMRNVNNGAILGMVYWFGSPPTTSLQPIVQGDINDHICGIPVSVSKDRVRLTNINPDRTAAELVTTYPGWLSNCFVTIFASDGITQVPLTRDPIANQNLAGATVPGTISINASSIPQQYVAYASYSLSYSTTYPQARANIRGGEIEPKSPYSGSSGASAPLSHAATAIPGTPCMGPDNMLFLTGTRAASVPSGGSILAYGGDSSILSNSGGITSTGYGKLKWHYLLHSGVDSSYSPSADIQLPGVVQTSQGPMLDPEPCSSPAVAGGKVFVTVSGSEGGPKAALLCFRASPESAIRITESGGFDSSGHPIKRPKSLWKQNGDGHYNVRIWQPNLINAASGGVPLMDAQDISSGGMSSTGINVDYDTGTITFDDFSRTKLTRMMIQTDTYSPSLPVWVYLDNVEVPIDWTTWGPGVIGAPPTVATSDAVDLSGWNNLLWYFVPPDPACSGAHSPPVVIGSTVYFTCDDGILYALDTESGESKAKETGKQPVWTTRLGNGTGAVFNGTASSVAGANGVLMVPGPDGLHAFTDTTTLVTDNSRVVEIDGQGEVTWSVDSVNWPAYAPSATGKSMAMKQGPVNKPSRARYANTGEILFANSGANQVCKIDKGGMVGFDGASSQYIRWIYTNFADPKHLLRSGQPTQLRSPTDAIMWQEVEPVASGGEASVVHCLIADSGNSRILDLTYRVKNGLFVDSDGNSLSSEFIDPDSQFVLPELNWVSKTDSLNERYAFDCLQLVSVPGTNNMRQDVWVASSNFTSNGTNTVGDSPKGGAGLGGAIMALGYRVRTQTTGAAAGPWTYNGPKSGSITARCDHVKLDNAVVPLANPRFFDVIVEPPAIPMDSPKLSLLICDNYGVYEAAIGGPVPVVGRRLLVQDYTALCRLQDPASTMDSACPGHPPVATPPMPLPGTPPLMAACVQQLPNKRWLITNSYSGSDKTGAVNFGGEVFEYDPNGPPSQQVTWCSPRIEWVKPEVPCTIPTQWKQITTNTYNLRQPKSAFRQQ
jgi:outer membrane protein assembly factor BamB